MISITSLATAVSCGEPPDEPGSTGGTSATGTSATGTSATGTSATGTSATGTSATGTTETGTTGTGPSACGSTDAPFRLAPTDDNNMTLFSDLKITEVPVAPSSLEITFDWSGITKDFFDHPFDPAKIVQVSLVPWNADTMTIQQGINVDDPELQNLTEVPAFFDPMATGSPVTSAKITDFKDAGGVQVPEDILLDYLDPANGYTLTLILQEDLAVGVDARMIQAFKPTAGATATVVSLTDASTSLEAMATFGTPLSVPAGTPDITFDYGGVATRSFGGVFTSQVFEVIVGKYPLDANVEMDILDIDYVYENFWRGPGPGVGTTVKLGNLKDGTGAAFPGIDAQSKYLVGVVCPSCTNPSPWFLSELQPCP